MSIVYKRVSDPVLAKKVECLEAEASNQKAMTDYIAMMADVDIPIEEEGEDNVV